MRLILYFIYLLGAALVINDLLPEMTYTFYLYVWNAVGASQPVKFRVTTPRRPAVKEQLGKCHELLIGNWEQNIVGFLIRKYDCHKNVTI